MFVGNKLRNIDSSKKIAIEQHAEYSGLSAVFLRNPERDSTSLTLEQPQQICLALGAGMVRLPESAQDDRIFIRENRRVKMFNNFRECLP